MVLWLQSKYHLKHTPCTSTLSLYMSLWQLYVAVVYVLASPWGSIFPSWLLELSVRLLCCRRCDVASQCSQVWWCFAIPCIYLHRFPLFTYLYVVLVCLCVFGGQYLWLWVCKSNVASLLVHMCAFFTVRGNSGCLFMNCLWAVYELFMSVCAVPSTTLCFYVRL